MRSFPSAPRRRAAAATLAAALTCGLGTTLSSTSPASAEGLRDRQQEIQDRIAATRNGIDEASDRAQRANAALDAATGRLADARDELARLEGEVAAAADRNAELRVELAASEERLAAAQTALIAGRIAVAQTRTEATDTITSIYQGAGDPGLRTLSSFLSAGSLEDIEVEQQAEQLIVGRQTTVYDEVQTAEARLEATEAEVAEATDLVAAQQAEAARTVRRMRLLRDRAVTARDQVLELVRTSRSAKQAALAARAEDQKALVELERQEAGVREKILAAQRAAERAGTGYTGETAGLFTMPSGGSITSPYGYRTHPIYGYYGLHDGTDFAPGCGAPLSAMADGTVISSYSSEVYGNRLYVSLGNVNGVNLTAVYNHASSYTVGVGERVSQGQTLGYVGDTGWSTGCHLHFTLLENGTAVDPMTYL